MLVRKPSQLRTKVGPLALVILASALVLAAGTWAQTAARTTRVSVSSAEAEANGPSFNGAGALSANGRFVVFHSDASNLVAGDTNRATDVFVRDRQKGTTRRMSVSSAGGEGNGGSFYPAISADGRFVAFHSYASNLVAGDTNGREDVFVRDRQTGTTRRVSVSSASAQANSGSSSAAISGDGRFVAFGSLASNFVPGDTNRATDVFVHDRRTGQTRRVSVSSAGAEGSEDSFQAAISANGRFVAFWSVASNLVARDTNGAWDVFVRDRQTGTTRRVSVSSAGAQGNGISFIGTISGDGRFVAFTSRASNLVAYDENGALDVFVRGPLRP